MIRSSILPFRLHLFAAALLLSTVLFPAGAGSAGRTAFLTGAG